MESLPNLEQVDIQKYLQVLQRRWLPVVGIFGISVTLGCLYGLSLKASYKATGSLMIKTNHTSSLTGSPENIGRLESLSQNENPLETQVRVVASNPVLEKTIQSLNLKDAKDQLLPIPALAGKLKVEGIKGSDVIQLSYKDNDPSLAKQVVNQVIDNYMDLNIKANQSDAKTAKEILVKELPNAEQSVRNAELKLRSFKERYKIIVLDQQATAAVDAISKLESQISQSKAQLTNVIGRLQQLRSQAQVNSQQGVIASELSQAPGVQKVLTQLQETESQLRVERIRFQPGHPVIVNLEEKVATLKKLLQERTTQVSGSEAPVQEKSLQVGALRQSLIADITHAEADRVGLENQINTLSQQANAYRQSASELPRLEQNQRELERKLKAAQTTYETLLKKRQEIDIAQNQKISNARVISYALLPDSPEGPRKVLFIVGGAAFGLFLGIIAAFSLDLIDRSVKTVKEAKEVLKYTLLGVIPVLGKNVKNHSSIAGVDIPLPKIIGRDIPHYPFGAAYQILQANLKFLCSDKTLKSIVVTSSVAKEGKSEVAANLAVTMAQMGRRVLLVDADMRHPIQHHVWGLTNATGLSNIIVDQVAIKSSVQEVMPNLDVLSSGVLPPNPLALLDSQRMATLIASFNREYDLVIFDTPSLSGMADAAVLSNLTDGILLVVRPGVVDWNSANSAKEFLTQSGQKVLGIVINGVNVKREPDSYFYYMKEDKELVSTSQKAVLTKTNSEVNRQD
jgi:polysaccharide biosynthesis transport protein